MAKNQLVDVFKKVDMKNGDKVQCWPWKGRVNPTDDRPYFTVAGDRRLAYAIVLELFSGELADGRLVRHSCDNSRCCNPTHLSWGSHQENMDDMKERERHGLSKITRRAIKNLADKGRSHATIADLYGISREAVTKIAGKDES